MAQGSSSDDGSYDSEEDRFMARQHSASWRQDVQLQAAEQLNMLRNYRVQRDAQAQLEELNLRARQDAGLRQGASSWHQAEMQADASPSQVHDLHAAGYTLKQLHRDNARC